jgi:hypothetical protein
MPLPTELQPYLEASLVMGDVLAARYTAAGVNDDQLAPLLRAELPAELARYVADPVVVTQLITECEAATPAETLGNLLTLNGLVMVLDEEAEQAYMNRHRHPKTVGMSGGIKGGIRWTGFVPAIIHPHTSGCERCSALRKRLGIRMITAADLRTSTKPGLLFADPRPRRNPLAQEALPTRRSWPWWERLCRALF